MKIIFIAGLFPKNEIKEYMRNTKGVFQFAADNLQKSILYGFKQHSDHIKIITVPFLSNFPGGYTKFFLKKKMFSFFQKNDDQHISVPFLNIKIFDLFTKSFFLRKALKKVIEKGDEVIIIYGMFSYFLSALPSNKKNITCLIVPDLPKMMGGDTSRVHIKIYLYFIEKSLKRNIDKIDCFVLISKHMVNYLNINNKPWIVMEGVYNNADKILPQEKEGNQTILYTGTLAKRYGILKLLESFNLIEDKNFRLWICGAGDGEKQVIEAVSKDARVKYFGQLPHEKILTLQQRATILVNPRGPDAEFTKYSFPSKTMEYLASGTPTIIYKLEGIPDEYYEHCFCCEDITSQGLRNKIIEVANLSTEQKKMLGKKAQRFIFEKKNAITQSEKILKMINGIAKYKN